MSIFIDNSPTKTWQTIIRQPVTGTNGFNNPITGVIVLRKCIETGEESATLELASYTQNLNIDYAKALLKTYGHLQQEPTK
jgi:hypothetical protein